MWIKSKIINAYKSIEEFIDAIFLFKISHHHIDLTCNVFIDRKFIFYDA